MNVPVDETTPSYLVKITIDVKKLQMVVPVVQGPTANLKAPKPQPSGNVLENFVGTVGDQDDEPAVAAAGAVEKATQFLEKLFGPVVLRGSDDGETLQ